MLKLALFALALVCAQCAPQHQQFGGQQPQHFGGQQHFGGGQQQQHFGGQQPQQNRNIIPANIINQVGPDGTGGFGYQTADGQMRTESLGPDGSVKGSYSYVGPDGKKVTINYTAGKNGFQASGDGIPTPPPAPAAPAPQGPSQQHQPSFPSFQQPQQSHFGGQDSFQGGFQQHNSFPQQPPQFQSAPQFTPNQAPQFNPSFSGQHSFPPFNSGFGAPQNNFGGFQQHQGTPNFNQQPFNSHFSG